MLKDIYVDSRKGIPLSSLASRTAPHAGVYDFADIVGVMATKRSTAIAVSYIQST